MDENRNPEVRAYLEKRCAALKTSERILVAEALVDDTFVSRKYAHGWFSSLGCTLHTQPQHGCLLVIRVA